MPRAAWIATSVALLALAVPLGRLEGSRAAATQIDRIEAVWTAVGPLDSPKLRAFRFDRGWACLFYLGGGRFYGYELCFDGSGRLVETADRRGKSPIFGSVAAEPELAPTRVSTATVLAVLRRHGVSEKVLRESGY